jgi:hypothetical protein
MANRHAITPRAAISAWFGLACLLAGACESTGALFPQGTQDTVAPSLPNDENDPSPNDGEPEPPEGSPAPQTPTTGPSQPSEGDPSDPDMFPPVSSVPDAGAPPNTGPDAPPDAGAVVVAPPRDVVTDGPVAVLPLLGVAGGDPRLGVCAGGVVVGVRTTANPSLDVFGQRVTFVEPLCGSVVREPASAPATDTLRVTRDDSLVAWAATDGFFGLPPTEVPDPSLVWVRQPETLCPEAAPVVIGLSGEYDPIVPDVVPDTAAVRSLFIECAPLVVAPDGVAVVAGATGHQLITNSFASPGASSYRSACDDGAVTTQIQVHAGFWLDGFLLGCSSLRTE